jgi:chaperone modulatory protein CbpM
MMLKRTEFMTQLSIDEQTLETWLAQEWIVPVRAASDDAFTEADVARARLIKDLIEDLGVNRPGVDIALHLLDQLHGAHFAVSRLHAGKKRA